VDAVVVHAELRFLLGGAVATVPLERCLKPSNPPPPAVAQLASAATLDSGARKPVTVAPRPPRSSVRRDGSLSS
jgi:hypothetical protein